MAGEVHPVPFRTRKLSPLAPMVLRSSPWESRTSLTNEGHLRAERAPSPGWWRGPPLCGPRARGPRPSAGGASLSGAPLIMSPGLVLGRLASPAMRRAVQSKQLRPAIWLDGGAFLLPCVTLPSANAPPGHLARRRDRGDAGGSSSGREGAFRAPRFVLHGFGQVILLRFATKLRTRGQPTMSAPLASL